MPILISEQKRVVNAAGFRGDAIWRIHIQLSEIERAN